MEGDIFGGKREKTIFPITGKRVFLSIYIHNMLLFALINTICYNNNKIFKKEKEMYGQDYWRFCLKRAGNSKAMTGSTTSEIIN